MAAVLPLHPLVSVPELRPAAPEKPWSPGRLIEIASGLGTGRTTLAVSILREAQIEGETAAWIQRATDGLYPPDLAAAGIDLDALAIVQLPATAPPHAVPRAAELLLRSGAFGVLILDLTAAVPKAEAWQSRLAALAREHEARVILLTTGRASLGPMVSLRVEPRRRRTESGVYEIEPLVTRSKGLVRADAEVVRVRAVEGLR